MDRRASIYRTNRTGHYRARMEIRGCRRRRARYRPGAVGTIDPVLHAGSDTFRLSEHVARLEAGKK